MLDEDLRRLARTGDYARLDREIEKLPLIKRPHEECDSCSGHGMIMGWSGPEDCQRDHTVGGVMLPIVTARDLGA